MEAQFGKRALDAVRGAGVQLCLLSVSRANRWYTWRSRISFAAPRESRQPFSSSVRLKTQTYLVASVRQPVEQTDESAPRKVPHAERTARMDELGTNLRGVSMSGELDRACSIAMP